MRVTTDLDDFASTLGVEEEYHLVDPVTLDLRTSPALAEQIARGTADHRLRTEMLTSQLEAATDVCATLDEVRSAVVAMRTVAAEAAAGDGATILATSTHPSASLDEVELASRDRYDHLVHRFGAVVRAFNLCGCHVHVAVPDLELAVQVMTHARPYLPLLNALTGSSPFHERADAGYESFRIAWLSLWQQGGPPPHLDTVDEYTTTVDALVRIGLVKTPRDVLWELRPSTRYPTLEFRGADVCTEVDDVVLLVGVIRALVRTLGRRVLAGTPAPRLSDTLLRAARWRAARYGLSGQLWCPTAERLMPADRVVTALMQELAPALRELGDYDEVRELTAQLLDRGTSARRQRERFANTGDLRDVIRDGIARTTCS